MIAPERCPDVYFTAGYGHAAATLGGGRWECAGEDERALLPYVLTGADGGVDAASPYGYSGVHVSASCPAGHLRRFWAAATDRLRDAGASTLFLRFSPLDDASRRAAAELPGLTVTRRGDTITVPTGGGADAVWAGLAGRARTAVRKAEQAGHRCRLRRAEAADLGADAPFRTLYERTMLRVGAAAGYHFPDGYYPALLAGLGGGLLLAEVSRPAEPPVAAALLMLHGDRVHYHLAGSAPAAGAGGAGNLLLWTVLRWAADTGRAVVHLGGGVSGEDGLFRFKRSFGGERTAFWTGAVVLDEAAYRRRLHEHAARLGVPPHQIERSGYFPGYRYVEPAGPAPSVPSAHRISVSPAQMRSG